MKDHAPLPFPKRFSKASRDYVMAAFTKGKRAKQGTARWDIPYSVIKFPKDAKDQVMIDLDEKQSLSRRVQKQMGRIVAQEVFRQEFKLQDYELTIEKGGVTLGRVNMLNMLKVDSGFE